LHELFREIVAKMKLKISKSVKEDSEDEEFYPEEESQNSQHSQNSASTATEQSESQDAATTTATITRPATRATRSSVLVSSNIVQFSIFVQFMDPLDHSYFYAVHENEHIFLASNKEY
jgi:hypothetical protein